MKWIESFRAICIYNIIKKLLRKDLSFDTHTFSSPIISVSETGFTPFPQFPEEKPSFSVKDV